MSGLFRGTDDVRNLRRVFSYLEFIGAKLGSNRVDAKQIKDSIGHHLKWWIDQFELADDAHERPRMARFC